jgi:tripartite-type tricarboxylate transporter receptor subunit TctC
LIAVSSATRSGVAADVPTVAEASGIRDFDITLWQGFFAPRGTPAEIVTRLNADINRILVQPDVRAKLLDAGADVTPRTVAQFGAFMKAESEKYLQIIKQAGLKPE